MHPAQRSDHIYDRIYGQEEKLLAWKRRRQLYLAKKEAYRQSCLSWQKQKLVYHHQKQKFREEIDAFIRRKQEIEQRQVQWGYSPHLPERYLSSFQKLASNSPKTNKTTGICCTC